jgi:paired box protein 2
MIFFLHFFFHLDSSYYYGNESLSQSQNTTTAPLNQDIRSPLAATRANSLASAASPTGSACTKAEQQQQPQDLFLV